MTEATADASRGDMLFVLLDFFYISFFSLSNVGQKKVA